jgi:hypothetical protein
MEDAMGEHALAELESRISALEIEARRLRRLAALLVAAIAGLAAIGATPRATTLEARQFVVRDAAGRLRALLGINELGDSRLRLHDAEGNVTADLGGTTTHPIR